MSERVELELDGDRGEIGAAVVRDSLSDTIKLLDAAAHSLEVEPPRWKIERLDLASVHAGLESPQNLGIVPLIWHGLEDLRERVVLPTGWSQDMLRHVRNLGRHSGVDGAQVISLVDPHSSERQTIDGVITDHAERALETSEVSWGALVGVIRRWNGGKRIVGLAPPGASGHPIDVKYPANRESEIMTSALGHTVEIWGEVERNVAGQVVRASMLDFKVINAAPPMSIREVAGLFADDPSYPRSVAQWVEEQRGDS